MILVREKGSKHHKMLPASSINGLGQEGFKLESGPICPSDQAPSPGPEHDNLIRERDAGGKTCSLTQGCSDTGTVQHVPVILIR